MVYNYTIPRRPPAASFRGPGPCYALPGLTGQRNHDPRSTFFKRPAYVFGLRPVVPPNFCTPAPYFVSPKIHRDGKDASIEYSMTGRPRGIKPPLVPGPGAYSPLMTHFTRIPAYSMGMRTRLRRSDSNPAPNCYSMPPILVAPPVESRMRRAPCYSMVGRSKLGCIDYDYAKTPAPGTYNTTNPDVYKLRPPIYSMATGAKMPDSSGLKPGPGAYSPDIKPIRPASPAFSFGIYHSPYVTEMMDDGKAG